MSAWVMPTPAAARSGAWKATLKPEVSTVSPPSKFGAAERKPDVVPRVLSPV